MQDRPARLTAAEGRKFAFTLGSAFAVLGGVLLWRDETPFALGAWGLATVLLLAGLLIPGRLGPVHRAWMGMATLLSRVTTPIVMGLLYFLILAPVGALLRLFGKISLEPPDEGPGYWVARENRHSDLTRQF